jgi:hypothetical protein
MRKILYLLSASILVFSSCKKNDDTSTSSTTDTYLPNTVGSNWTYQVTTAGTTTTAVTYTVSNRDTTANSRTYNVITGSNGTNQYYSKNGSDYYNFRAVGTLGIELLFLKDNVALNGTWTTSQNLTGLTGLPISAAVINNTYTVQEKGTTRTVNGVLYSNIIKVRADINATATVPGVPVGIPLSLGYAEFYFSKNIGIVESNIQIANATAGININELYKIQSYVIK